MKKRILKIAGSIILVSALLTFYITKVSRTKIGLINYPNFLYTKIAKSNDNTFVTITSIDKASLNNLDQYDMLLIFGMGIRLSQEDVNQINMASTKGSKVFLQSSTNPSLKLTNIKGDPFDKITDYLSFGGNKNYRQMTNYIRKKIDCKWLFVDSIIPPKKIASNVLFHKDPKVAFEKVSDFEKYCIKNHIHKKGQKKIILFTSVPGPFNANRDHIDDIVDLLSSNHVNVYPISGFSGRLDYMKQIDPDLIIYLPHGRLSMGGGSSSDILAYLKKQNVPVLCPITVFTTYEKWLKDKQGMFGGLLSQSVTMPEFDGGIVPYAVFAQFKDNHGYLIFDEIPGRLKKFGQIVHNYLQLRNKKKSDKKLAIVYFKGPGKNALVASNMEVLPSIFNLLCRLKKEGYNLGQLPSDYKEFEKEVLTKGPILGPYAKGAFSKYLKNGDPELISSKTYEQWCRQTFPQTLYQEVVDKYGKAPGSYMSVLKNGKEYLAISRVQFGNVVLLPQPLPGLGKKQFQLIHGAKTPPPHAYIAPYLWIQKGFKADAICHFGTHGSLEFTPGKQIALSSYDWTDPLIGTTPHIYIYTISNVGEGVIAKRRSYGVLQTYLTPPFSEAKAAKEEEEIRQKLHKYTQATGALKSSYALSVKKLMVARGIHNELGLDSLITSPYSSEEMMRIDNYFEEIDHEKITQGLYTMGVPYTDKEVNQTILLMYQDALSNALMNIDIEKRKISKTSTRSKRNYYKQYVSTANKAMKQVLNHFTPLDVFKSLVNTDDIERANAWKLRSEEKSRLVMDSVHDNNSKKDTSLSDSLKIRKFVLEIMSEPAKRDFILKMESQKEFERALKLIDPKKSAMIRQMSKFIPEMKKAVEVANNSSVRKLLQWMQQEQWYTLVLKYTKDNGLLEEVKKEHIKHSEALLHKIENGTFSYLLKWDQKVISSSSLTILDSAYHDLLICRSHKKELSQLLDKNKQSSTKEITSFLKDNLDSRISFTKKELQKRSNKEQQFYNAVHEVEKTLFSIVKKRKQLKESPEYEMKAILNTLNGGYTPPSPGGDPVTNPQTIPTGRNMYSISAEYAPSKEAWEIGKKLASQMLIKYQNSHENQYPKKVSFTLWSSSFIETEGATIAQILYILGVEPIWDPFGRVSSIEIIPIERLQRPHIDVVIQTSGQLRDLAASRLFLIQKAIHLIASLPPSENNFVSQGVKKAEDELVKQGLSPVEAKAIAQQRIFGGVNGNYTTGIMDMVERGDQWNDRKQIANTYINNMGASYGNQEEWGAFKKEAFRSALQNTDVVIQPRQSNTWGALSLDHVYEFMGGINLAVKEVTGKEPEAYFNDFRNTSNPRIQNLKEAIWVESRTTLLNPKYIQSYMKGGASSAENFAETFRNTYGWNVMKPSVIDKHLWDELYDVYVQDKKHLGIHQFFEKENPYALQEITAVMLETVRKGMWNASVKQIETMTKLHAELVKSHKAACSEFVCNNPKLKTFIQKNLSKKDASQYSQNIERIRKLSQENRRQNIVLKKEKQHQQREYKKSKVSHSIPLKRIVIAIATILLILSILAFRRRQS
ncbi:cobaltochelatase subunit CobN [Halosquirtibacter laminarini]|uniref:Cobaltochelatase subunit CobN n=1 Tax=Halosquirtibacter laminarini TaxID=3374600 RepID=A0AC61NR42_9BACT|nr:cobaltochelatase subunit CobN [Prolixibacteraceae bacterium]